MVISIPDLGTLLALNADSTLSPKQKGNDQDLIKRSF